MSTNTDKEDEQWLSALAGQSDSAADPKINQQAESLRRALKNRSDLLTKQAPIADDAQYQQLLFRLRREGLASSNRAWHNPKLWGLAATVVIGVGVVVQMERFNVNDDGKNILRGGGHHKVMIVADPEARLTELKVGLRLTGEKPKVDWQINCEIQVTIKATEKVQDYLDTQRIDSNVKDGYAIFGLAPTPPHNTCFWKMVISKFGE